MSDGRARAVVLTGMAFPVGALLGAVLGVLTAPRNTQGFGDIVWTLLWFLVTGAPVTMLVFWFATRPMEWSWQQRQRALLGMARAVFLASGVLLFALWFGGRNGNGAFVFVALPLCAFVVTRRAQRLLKP